MNRLFYIILASIICLVSFSGCNDDENDYPDIRLIHGEWKVVWDDDDTNYGATYNFIPKSELTDSWGTLIIQYPTHSDQAVEEKTYSWYASNPINDGGVINLEITYLHSNNPDNQIEDTEYYFVEKLDKKDLWLQCKNGNSSRMLKLQKL